MAAISHQEVGEMLPPTRSALLPHFVANYIAMRDKSYLANCPIIPPLNKMVELWRKEIAFPFDVSHFYHHELWWSSLNVDAKQGTLIICELWHIYISMYNVNNTLFISNPSGSSSFELSCTSSFEVWSVRCSHSSGFIHVVTGLITSSVQDFTVIVHESSRITEDVRGKCRLLRLSTCLYFCACNIMYIGMRVAFNYPLNSSTI